MIYDSIKKENWKVVPLSEVATYISRGKQPKYVERSEVFTLNQKAIQWGQIVNEYLKFHNPDVKVDEKHFIKAGDLVINSTGTGTVGRVYHFDNEPNIKVFADSHVTIIRTNEDKLLSKFLMYQLSNERYQEFIINSFLAGSTGQVELNKSKVQEFPILIPPLSIQKEIVNVLGSLDAKINVNRKCIGTLENIAQSLLKRWFIDFEFPNDEGFPYKSSGGKLVESELGEIPDEWNVGRAGDLFEFSPTERVKKGDEIPFIEMKNLASSAMIYEWTNREFKGSGSKFRNGDTLLARITPCLENGKIGFVDVMNDNEIGWGSTEFIVIRSKVNIDKTFSYFFTSEQNFKDYAVANMNGSSGRQRVKAETLADYEIAVPPIKLIEKFTNVSSANIEMMSCLKEEILHLQGLRDSLLPKLLSGEIEIPDESVVDGNV